jgi:hypothetical protein
VTHGAATVSGLWHDLSLPGGKAQVMQRCMVLLLLMLLLWVSM